MSCLCSFASLISGRFFTARSTKFRKNAAGIASKHSNWLATCNTDTDNCDCTTISSSCCFFFCTENDSRITSSAIVTLFASNERNLPEVQFPSRISAL